MSDLNFLEIKNVSFSYPGQKSPVLKDISFIVPYPGLYGIAGSNGSGKSTLLKCIAGFEDASGGEIVLRGVPVTGPSRNSIPGHNQIKLIGQERKLENAITVEENISRKLLGYQLKFRNQKTKFLLEHSGLSTYSKKFPKELSGGQQQMLSILCALAEEPELLLLDEPFVSLDVFSRENILNYLSSLLRELNICMILVSHDSRDLLGYSNRILVLGNGKIIMDSSPEEIYFSPVNEYAAGLFGPYGIIRYNRKKEIVRPSEILVSSTGKFLFIIEREVYKGDFSEYTAVNKKKEEIIFYAAPGKYSYGDPVRVDFA